MANPNVQSHHRKESDEYARQSEIYKQAFDTAEGNYEQKHKAALEASAQHRKARLGEKFRSQIARQVAHLAPAPVAGEGEPESELRKLSREKVSAWLKKYQGNLKDALVTMFQLEPKYRMTDVELAHFVDELKNPAHLEQRTFFSVTDWLKRVERHDGKVPASAQREKLVIDSLLAGIEKGESPADISIQDAA